MSDQSWMADDKVEAVISYLQESFPKCNPARIPSDPVEGALSLLANEQLADVFKIDCGMPKYHVLAIDMDVGEDWSADQIVRYMRDYNAAAELRKAGTQPFFLYKTGFRTQKGPSATRATGA